jgi:LysR family transcriptional regulator, regulator for genes of the gallate degradation pathway
MNIWQLNIRHLRAAAEITHLGSINAAADAVNLTQPAITQALAKMEALLAQPLFERRHDGMKPTVAMRLFAPRIEAALEHIGSRRVTMTQIRALIALGDAGSYLAASHTTGLSQPSLHRAIGDLALGLKRNLVERRGKGIMLTGVGRQQLRAYRLARAELEAGLSEIEGQNGRETGRITIGAMPLSRARILPDAIARFHRKNPDVHLSIIEGSWHELAEPLRDGELDLMVGALRDPSPGDDLMQYPLFDDRPCVIGRKGHPLSGMKASISDIARYPWIVPPPQTPLREQWHAIFDGTDVMTPDVPIDCGSVMMIRQILLNTDFLTLLSPDQVAVELEANWLEIICDVPHHVVRNIGVTTRFGWRPTRKQRCFLDEIGCKIE